MIVSRIYETKNGDLTAVVLEDGKYINFIADPELVAMEEGLIGDARYGFPDALSYDEDISEGASTEEMAKLQESESTLIAEVGEEVIIYPRRMSPDIQELIEMELGEELWKEALEDVNGDEGVQVNI